MIVCDNVCCVPGLIVNLYNGGNVNYLVVTIQCKNLMELNLQAGYIFLVRWHLLDYLFVEDRRNVWAVIELFRASIC